MTEFKVGDRVRDTSDDEKGTIYSIENGMARVEWDESGLIGGYNIVDFPGVEPELLFISRPDDLTRGEPVDPTVPKPDMVEHPPHYNQHPTGIECITIIEENPFLNLGNAMKYLWRVSWGGKGDDREDLEKAIWYIKREISRRGLDKSK